MADDFTDTDDNSKFLGEEDLVLDERCTLSKVLTSLNDHMATLAKSMQTMGESISELRQPSSTATAKRDSRAVGSLASKPKRQRTALVSVNRDPEVEALLARSDNDNGSQNQIENVACESTAEGDEEDELLKTLAAEYMSEDMTSSPVSSQLAAILDKSWSCTLSETKLKEKATKYYRPQNCERMLAPKVNPEIWSRISNLGQRQDLKFVTVQKALACAGAALAKSTQVLLDSRPSDRDDDGDSQRNEILTSQIDALALLGHANYQLSLRRREMLKPFLKKDYAALCSSQTAVTSLIFGDELQNQLAAIRASNRITNTAVQADQRSSGSSRSQSSRVWRSKSYNNREKSFFYKGPYPRLTNNKYSPSQQKPRRGANRQ